MKIRIFTTLLGFALVVSYGCAGNKTNGERLDTDTEISGTEGASDADGDADSDADGDADGEPIRIRIRTRTRIQTPTGS